MDWMDWHWLLESVKITGCFFLMFAAIGGLFYLLARHMDVREQAKMDAEMRVRRPEGCICSEAFGVGPDKCPAHRGES